MNKEKRKTIRVTYLGGDYACRDRYASHYTHLFKHKNKILVWQTTSTGIWNVNDKVNISFSELKSEGFEKFMNDNSRNLLKISYVC